MSRAAPLATTFVGVVVERRKAKSPWVDYLWRPVAALPGVPEMAPWTLLEGDEETAQFYVGGAEVGLHRPDTPRYRDNLASGDPSLWVVLRPTGREPPFEVFMVTADPSEGESMTGSGNDLVEPVPMPDPVRQLVEEFVAEHHVERAFQKRKQKRGDPEALARRVPLAKDGKP